MTPLNTQTRSLCTAQLILLSHFRCRNFLPSHEISHQINIVAVNVRPYQYAHHKRNEIEKMVDDMLQAGIIQASTSPYSRSALLVKKKDGI